MFVGDHVVDLVPVRRPSQMSNKVPVGKGELQLIRNLPVQGNGGVAAHNVQCYPILQS